MAISFPLTPPATPGNRSIVWTPRTIVGRTVSPFTGQQQVFAFPGQWWEVTVTLPMMRDADAGAWHAFMLSLNGAEGTFYLGDSVRKTALGNVTGTLTVGGGAVANSTTLPIAGATGTFAVGDWLSVNFGSLAPRLHRVIKVIDATSVDVFPRLRAAYTAGSSINYSSPVGRFRLMAPSSWSYDERKLCDGFSFSAVEAL